MPTAATNHAPRRRPISGPPKLRRQDGDEDRDYREVKAVRALKQEVETKYQYVLEPLDASPSEQTVKLRARLTETFSGSPVALDDTFTLANEKITSLEIR